MLNHCYGIIKKIIIKNETSFLVLHQDNTETGAITHFKLLSSEIKSNNILINKAMPTLKNSTFMKINGSINYGIFLTLVGIYLGWVTYP